MQLGSKSEEVGHGTSPAIIADCATTSQRLFFIHWEVSLSTSAKRTNPASNIHRSCSIYSVSFKVRGPKKALCSDT